MSLRVQINNKLEHKFRETAMKRFGYTKGALSKAAEEAILNWISTIENETATFEDDPVKAIEGLLKDADVESVTLQHETQKLWIKKEPDFDAVEVFEKTAKQVHSNEKINPHEYEEELEQRNP
jgi:hypothetical protein